VIDAFRQDLRYSIRRLRRSPGFAALAILTLAIGIGANAAIFSIVNTVLLRPLPFADPSRLVFLQQNIRQTKATSRDASPANFLDWRARNHSLSGLAALRDSTFALAGGDRPERVGGAIVNANFFEVLGVAPALGRTFQPADEQPGAPRAAILSDALWRQHFGGRPQVIGQSVRLNDEPHTIVGVMPPGIDYPDKAGVWVPPHWRVPDDSLAAGQDPSSQRSHGYIHVVGRLKPGVTERQARSDLDAVAASLERDYPNDNQNVGVELVPLHAALVGDIRPMVLMLFAAVVLVLLIATGNVSGLLIARATAAHQEVAVRMALGATRGRIVRQVLTESVLLAVIGGAAGVLLAMWLATALLALSPIELTMGRELQVDVNIVLFALAVSIGAGVIFGLAPARQSLHVNVHEDLKQTARGASSVKQRQVRAVLVAAEIAFSLVLLVAAGLTIKSLIKLQREPAGFDPDRVLTVTVSLSEARYATPQLKADFWARALAALEQTRGFQAIGATSRLPLSGGTSTRGLTVAGAPPNVPSSADYRVASPGYFGALGIPFLRGRYFSEADREDRPKVAIVSAAMVARFWPAIDPIGRQFAIGRSAPMTVVGVVGDVHHTSLASAPQPTFYVPYRQDPWPTMTFVLRTTAPPATLANAVREAIWSIDKDQPVSAVLTMDERLSHSVSLRRFGVTLLTAFGVIAVALAAIGLYGVLAFIVAQRRKEIGVRMALGASPHDVVADVMGHGLRLAGVGVVLGIALALAVTRLMTTLLYGTSPTDVATFASVATLLIAVAACASAVPALRASRVDPLVALRDE
jgi:putative ABC transport system permease protein